MRYYSLYSVKIKHYNHILKETVSLYRKVTDFFLQVCLKEWDVLSTKTAHQKLLYMEQLCHQTKKNPNIAYKTFDQKFYKFPSYLRRAAITEAIGKVSSYKSNLGNWANEVPTIRGRKPSLPKAGLIYPCLYRENMYQQTGKYTARIKVYVRYTWDWINIQLRKSDVDYIHRHCSNRKQCAPTLQKHGHQWFLDFPFEETVTLNNTSLEVEVAVDSSHINSIRFSNLDETVATMYPLIQPAIENIAEQVYDSQSLENISFPEDNPYTSQVIINAIDDALKKATVK